jgi:hypothetical protein
MLGYTDIDANIDLSSFRRIPWENNVPFFLVRCSAMGLIAGKLFK